MMRFSKDGNIRSEAQIDRLCARRSGGRQCHLTIYGNLSLSRNERAS